MRRGLISGRSSSSKGWKQLQQQEMVAAAAARGGSSSNSSNYKRELFQPAACEVQEERAADIDLEH